MKALFIAAAIALPLSAHAEAPPTPHTVQWYKANPVTLDQTLRVCHSSAVYANTPDCFNAESAGAGRMADQWARAARSTSTSMYDPNYWSRNRFARAGIIAQCQRRGQWDYLAYPYCQAAALSVLQDGPR